MIYNGKRLFSGLNGICSIKDYKKKIRLNCGKPSQIHVAALVERNI